MSKALVPLDGSEVTELILPYVSQLASGLHIPVVVLSVIARGETPHAAFPPGLLRKVEAEAGKRLKAITDQLGDDGVRAEAVITSGTPAEEIVGVAKSQGCDLIAMTTHGRAPVARGVLGSVTDKVIHSSHLPVLTITPERAATYGSRDPWMRVFTRLTQPIMTKIMVPLDGSRLAETVLPHVMELARRLSLRVLLVRVVRGFNIQWLDREPGAYSFAQGEEDAMEAEATRSVEATAEKLGQAGLDVRWQVPAGHPATVIAELAEQEPHDIIAIATHRRKRWALGSVAEALVRGTGDPVLVVTPRTGVAPKKKEDEP